MALSVQDLGNVSDDAKALAQLMQTTLDRVTAIYESYSMPIPDRRYWTLGSPAVDCEQLVVTFMQMYIGSPGNEATEPSRCNDPRSATLQVRVSRNVPTVGVSSKAPKAEDIQSYSELTAYDAWVLLASVNQIETWSDADPLGLGVIATIDVADQPEGGYHTTVLTLTVAVP
jgi:hypothetical protein